MPKSYSSICYWPFQERLAQLARSDKSHDTKIEIALFLVNKYFQGAAVFHRGKPQFELRLWAELREFRELVSRANRDEELGYLPLRHAVARMIEVLISSNNLGIDLSLPPYQPSASSHH